MKLKWPFGKKEPAQTRTSLRPARRAQTQTQAGSRIGQIRAAMSRRDPRFKSASTQSLISAVVELIDASAHTDSPPGRAFVIESADGQLLAQGVDFASENIAVMILPDGAITTELGGMAKVREQAEDQGRVLWYTPPRIAEIAPEMVNVTDTLKTLPAPTETPSALTISQVELVVEEYAQTNGRTPSKRVAAELIGCEPDLLTQTLRQADVRWLDLVAAYEPHKEQVPIAIKRSKNGQEAEAV